MGYLPVTHDKLFEYCQDGILLLKLLEQICPGTVQPKHINTKIDKNKINKVGAKDYWEIVNNLNNLITLSESVNCKVVNIGFADFIDKNEDIILGLIWQLIRIHLLHGVNLMNHPELVRLLKEGETISNLLKIPSEEIILRWFNHHISKVGMTIKNFTVDTQDCTKWIELLKAVIPGVSIQKLDEVGNIEDLTERADKFLKFCEPYGIRGFTSVPVILKGNSRLNLAFSATIFNKYVGITLPSNEEINQIHLDIQKFEEILNSNQVELLNLQISLDEISKNEENLNIEISNLNLKIKELELDESFENNKLNGMQNHIENRKKIFLMS